MLCAMGPEEILRDGSSTANEFGLLLPSRGGRADRDRSSGLGPAERLLGLADSSRNRDGRMPMRAAALMLGSGKPLAPDSLPCRSMLSSPAVEEEGEVPRLPFGAMLIRLPKVSMYSTRPAGSSATLGKGKSGIVSRDQRAISGECGDPHAIGWAPPLSLKFLLDLVNRPAPTEPKETKRALEPPLPAPFVSMGNLRRIEP